MSELKLKSQDELRRLAQELQEKLRDARFKVATRQLTKVRELRALKKDLARITMILTQPAN